MIVIRAQMLARQTVGDGPRLVPVRAALRAQVRPVTAVRLAAASALLVPGRQIRGVPAGHFTAVPPAALAALLLLLVLLLRPQSHRRDVAAITMLQRLRVWLYVLGFVFSHRAPATRPRGAASGPEAAQQ